jgi:Anti-sigma factor NepR
MTMNKTKASRRIATMDENNPAPKRAPKLGPDIKAKIGVQLRVLYGEVVAQGVPDRFKAILAGLPDEDEDGSLVRGSRADGPPKIDGEPKIDRDPKIGGDPKI